MNYRKILREKKDKLNKQIKIVSNLTSWPIDILFLPVVLLSVIFVSILELRDKLIDIIQSPFYVHYRKRHKRIEDIENKLDRKRLESNRRPDTKLPENW